MIIWFAFIIPVFFSVLLLLYYREKLAKWEIPLMFFVTFVVILLVKSVGTYSACRDYEYWGHLGLSASYEEPYSYMSTCTTTYPCGKSTCTSTYPCVQESGDVGRIYVMDNVSHKKEAPQYKQNSIYIRKQKFDALVSKWKGHQYNRKITNGDYYGREAKGYGGFQVVSWDNNWKTAENIVTVHSWENRVQASEVYHWEEITRDEVKKYGLYEYPQPDGYNIGTILDIKNTYFKADKYFQFVNSKLGPKKRLRIWVLILRQVDGISPTTETAKKQFALWHGGKKNEFNFVMGVDADNKLLFGEIMSWSDNEELKIEARDRLNEIDTVNDDSLFELAQWSEENLGKKFMKKDFREFNYLSVEPSGLYTIISVIFILMVNIALSIWVVKNDITDTKRRW